MPAADIDTIDDHIERRLDTLRKVLAQEIVFDLPVAPIVFLSTLLTTGDLRNLRFDRDTEPTSAQPDPSGRVQSMEIVSSPRGSLYRISRRTRVAMCKVAADRKLDTQQTDWMIDNYFIHELLHFAQGMSGGNHSGLGRQAPPVLLAVDYQADALAAMVATILAWCSPGHFGFHGDIAKEENHWALYARAIEAILHQMEIFTLLMRRDMDRTAISGMRVSIERLLRIATWHYQLHRARAFDVDRPLADFQILAQPMLSFRNLAWAASFAPDALRKDWPQREQDGYPGWKTGSAGPADDLFALHECPPLIVTGTTHYATTRFVRHTPTTQQYADAFAGFFENDTRASRDFFNTLFMNHTWLRGGPDRSAFSHAWDLPETQRDPLASESQGLASGAREQQRLDLLNELLTPSRFPLVLFAA